jgi:hypothetical protein
LSSTASLQQTVAGDSTRASELLDTCAARRKATLRSDSLVGLCCLAKQSNEVGRELRTGFVYALLLLLAVMLSGWWGQYVFDGAERRR